MSALPVLRRRVAAFVARDVLVAYGPEAGAYLHGQISADVSSMEIGDSSLSFLLEPRGRIEAFFIINRTGPDTYVADIDAGFGESMAASLERFKLRTRVDFSLGQWQMRAVRGPLAADERTGRAASCGPAASSGPEEHPTQVVRRSHWPLVSGHDMLISPGGPGASSQASALGEDADAEVISASELDALRMAFGLPAMGREIQPGDIPNETGLVQHAASFTKGCYRGQELVERIDSRAGGRRTVCRLVARAPLAPGDELVNGDGTTVATVLSSASLDGVCVGFARSRRTGDEGAFSAAGEPVQFTELF